MSTRVSFRFKKDNFCNDDLTDCSKVIRLQSNGFCIAVYQSKTREVYVLEEHVFEEDYPLNGKMHLLSQVESQWKTQEGTHIICFNSVNTQIPQSLYDKQYTKFYLQLLTEQVHDYHGVEEAVDAWGLYSLSGWDKQLYSKIRAQFPNSRLHSGMYCLLQKLSQQTDNQKAIVFIENNNLHIATSCGNQLLGCNRFHFQNESDYLYYLIGFLHDIQGDLKHLKLYMGGEIETNSLLYTSTFRYIQKLELIPCTFSGLQTDQHRFFDLLCEGL